MSNARRVVEVDWIGRSIARGLAWSSDNNALAFANDDHGVMFHYRDRNHELELGQAFTRFDPPDDPVFCVDISPDGSLVAAGTNITTINVWNYDTGDAVPMEEVRYTGEIQTVAFSPDGTLIAAAGQDTDIHLWDATTGQYLHVFEGHNDWVFDLAFRPNGQYLASASLDNTVRVWDMITFDSVSSTIERDYDAVSVAYSPDSTELAAGFSDGTIVTRKIETGREVRLKISGTVWSLAYSPDGSILAAGNHDSTITLWNIHRSRTLTTLDGHTDSVKALEFSPDGVLLASASEDDGIRYWGVAVDQQDLVD